MRLLNGARAAWKPGGSWVCEGGCFRAFHQGEGPPHGGFSCGWMGAYVRIPGFRFRGSINIQPSQRSAEN
jgi:hypothetical protein